MDLGTYTETNSTTYGVHPNHWKWEPSVDGPAFEHFLTGADLPEAAKNELRRFTPRILGQSRPPRDEGRSTGLVIGKVQSGKTNSFLALTALASDNGYKIIIILSGTKNVLRDQTFDQVEAKLSQGVRTWRAVSFEADVDRSEFERRLGTAMSRVEPRTLIITILKRTRATSQQRESAEGIDRLSEFIESSNVRARLTNEPVLIIDDEADEASLDNSANARRAGRAVEVTATYRAIEKLRSHFKHHLFIQYTATPQANLLVELSDELSPDFCELLEPGDGYCGAAELFPPDETFFREIPLADRLVVAQSGSEPPQTLTEAVHRFFVGAALEDLLDEEKALAVRSMLVHPERAMASHTAARDWAESITSLLQGMLTRAVENPAGRHAESIYSLIRAQLLDLARTVSFDIEDIDMGAIAKHMLNRVQDSTVRMINSQQQLASGINWEQESCWIFVGGDVLQRGFAIRGLTVSWVARAQGQGQVDVLMQRGRFFGYRAAYLDYCRLWLPRQVHDDYYAKFADHEEALWRLLRKNIESGKTLKDWSRIFWLDRDNADMQLCRRSIQWVRTMEHPEWALQRWIPSARNRGGVARAARNQSLVAELLSSVEDGDWDRRPWPHPTTRAQDHRLTWMSVEEARGFLDDYNFFGGDEVDLAVVLDSLTVAAKEKPAHRVALFHMRYSYPGYERGQKDPEIPKIETLLGGRGRRKGMPDNYPGDSEFRPGGAGLPAWSSDSFAIQVHLPRIILRKGKTVPTATEWTAPDQYLRNGCPMLAIYVPERFRHYTRERPGERVRGR